MSWSCGPSRTRPRSGSTPATPVGRTTRATCTPSGRLSDTINRGGEKFGPVEVEEVLRTHPSVVDVGVVGVPDDELGERVGAVVVVSEPVSPEELTGYCASHLATFKVPEYLQFADELPISVLGKLNRPALRELLRDAPVVARAPH